MGFSEDRAQGRFKERYFLLAANPYLLWDAVENWKAVWRKQRNNANSRIDWQFTTADARIKLKRLYPTLDT